MFTCLWVEPDDFAHAVTRHPNFALGIYGHTVGKP